MLDTQENRYGRGRRGQRRNDEDNERGVSSSLTDEQIEAKISAAIQAQKAESDQKIARLQSELSAEKQKHAAATPTEPIEEIKKTDYAIEPKLEHSKAISDKVEAGIDSIGERIKSIAVYPGKILRVAGGIVVSPFKAIDIGFKWIGSAVGGLWKGLSEALFPPRKTA